ncbi:AAA family ATPase [Fibrella forsythiae]|uniref:AAA family ATPase n=1 Tax=Fibrella forsythiae TaxID=2817061 RepID=A0ABS3JFI7_9BACT|nr:AAA family ATPase [Fibrella forsythiae]MBO0948059.1 AAA family ATPase [Fibrella forsythiae]
MLKRVSIQNFKSLKDVTLNLQPVNLLIGPNNSGKTNFLKALDKETLSLLGSNRIDTFKELTFKHKPVDVTYSFDYLPDINGLMSKLKNNNPNTIYHYSLAYTLTTDENNSWIKTDAHDSFINESRVELPIETFPGHMKEFINYKSATLFRPDPSRLIHQVKLSADDLMLLPDCSNLVSFLYYIETNFRNTYSKQLKEDFTRCVPEITYFTMPPVKVGNDSLLSLRFFDKEDVGYWANEVSEGVLYFLMLLGIVNQPNPPKLLLLEEPERGIHPRRIREVMNFIFRLAEEKGVQIILTTHNEHVLDQFTTWPEAVFVFEKDDEGATHVKNLLHDIIEPSHEKSINNNTAQIDFTSNLGDNWMYGLLGGVPEEVL